MQSRILDVDGSLLQQDGLMERHPAVVAARDWGPRLRMACTFRQFRRFESALESRLEKELPDQPAVTLYGSGDFHHISLALIRRLRTPFNLLVFDKHPDWMRGLPFLHCGTWLYHAARLPLLQRVFHVGGELDFDNGFRWLAPWDMLRAGKITVIPAERRFRRWPWKNIVNEPLRTTAAPVNRARIEELLRPFQDALARWPLYISIDKDVLGAMEAVVNWDSGLLTLAELIGALEAFTRAAGGKLVGVDITGDWSAVEVHGWFRRALHAIEHAAMTVDPCDAARRNERTNLALLDCIGAVSRRSQPAQQLSV